VSQRMTLAGASRSQNNLLYERSPADVARYPRLVGNWEVDLTSGWPVTREQRGSVELVRSSHEYTGDFESSEEASCCPDFGVTTRALCVAPPVPHWLSSQERKLSQESVAPTSMNAGKDDRSTAPPHPNAGCNRRCLIVS
jgi:hypothetical protein